MAEVVLAIVIINLLIGIVFPIACTLYLMERVFSVQAVPPKMKKQKAFAGGDRRKPKIIQESDEIRIEKELQDTPRGWS